MQDIDWNDLRYVLAVSRSRSVAEAGRQMAVDETTVSRHIKRLESRLLSSLFIRQGSGALEPSELGRRVIAHAENVEAEMAQLGAFVSETRSGLFGSVRITSVPVIVNRILAPSLGPLLSENPGLNVELVPESRDLSLTQREADLALRLARPRDGGLRVKARKLGELSYAVYAAKDLTVSEAATPGWIGFDDAFAHLPQAKWLDRTLKSSNEVVGGLRVSDTETAIEAVRAGLGKALLPTCVAQHVPEIRRIDTGSKHPPPRREIWLLSHRMQQRNRVVDKTIEWIEGIGW